MLEPLADDVHTGSGRDAAVLLDAPVRRHDRQPKPGMVRPVAGGKQDGADSLGAQVQRRRQRQERRQREDAPRATPRGQARPARCDRRRRRESGASAGRRPRPCRARSSRNVARPAVSRSSRPVSRTPFACSAARSRSLAGQLRVVAADELHGRLLACGRHVRHVVDRAGKAAGALQPPEDVHPAVAAGHPGVPADSEHDRTARSGKLVSDLHARRRSADDEHATGRQLRRVAVLRRCDHLERRPARIWAGTVGVPCGPVATTTWRARQVPWSVTTRYRSPDARGARDTSSTFADSTTGASNEAAYRSSRSHEVAGALVRVRRG